MARVRDSVVVITGASSGIGRATALEFARQGAAVVLAARREDELEGLAAVCRDLSGLALAVPADVTHAEDLATVARRAVETFGRIDVWVNNAGVTMFGAFDETPEDTWRAVVETNLFGSANGARAVLPYFREQGGGILIEVNSVLGKLGAPYWSAYVASKFALAGLAESLRSEVRRDGIRVCSAFLGTTDTPLFQQAANFSGQAVKPVPPVTEPDVAARAIVRLVRFPRPEAYVGRASRSVVWMRRRFGRFGERLIASWMVRQQFRPWPATPSRGNVFEPSAIRASTTGGWRSPSSKAKWPVILGATLATGGSVGAALLLLRAGGRR